MARRDRPPRGREGRHHGRRPHQREEDLLRRRQPQHAAAGARPRTPSSSSTRAEHQGRPAPARDARQAGRRRDQRRRARWRPRDRAGQPPPHRGRGPLRDRPARGHARPAARWRRRRTHGADARPADRADRGAAPGPALQARAGQGEGAGRRGRPRRPAPRRGQDVDPRARGRRERGQAAVGPPGLQDARRHPVPPEPRRRCCRCSRRRCASSLKGADYPAPRAIMAAAVEGAQVDFETAPADRGALLHRAGDRPEREEHDPGVLLRPAGDQLRLAAARRASTPGRPPRSACSAPG